MAQLHSLPSFSHHAADREPEEAVSDAGSASDDDDDAGFEFAFAPPLTEEGSAHLGVADDLFAHGRILPAYPVFDRGLVVVPDAPRAQASTAPPSPDTYCAWAPRSAPGSPARGDAGAQPFPKSSSTGESRRFRLRDLIAGGGRSHSDGKEKFVFLQPAATASPSKMSHMATAAEPADGKQSTGTRPSPQKQSKKKGKAGVTEMDMATAHRLFYGKQAGAAAGGDRKQHSYLPYRPGIVGFFATAHALGRSHHPY
ncbi:hypothetical protein ACP70R_028961 [Stipagrostis hirtigluma subsp. patula]